MAEQVLIRGIPADSQQEVNVAMALERLGLDYHYQRMFGIPGVRGSQIIDFLVFTIPKPTPLFVHGRYWHQGKRAIEEQLKLSEIAITMKDTWAEPVIIWTDDCETVDDAVVALRKLLWL